MEQSLLAHTLVVLDTLATVCPLLDRQGEPLLRDATFAALLIAAVIHDAGKAGKEFQAYIRGGGPRVGHWDDAAVEQLAADVAAVVRRVAGIELSPGEMVFAVNAARGSERGERLRANLLQLTRPPAVPKETFLREILVASDHLASCSTVVAARESLDRFANVFARQLEFTYHQVRLRGVTTTFLHRALQAVHEAAGWQPLLFYVDGTLYVADTANVPVPDQVRAQIALTCTDALSGPLQQASSLVVGSVLGTFLPKPELFDSRLVETYLEVAAGKAKARSPDKVGAKNVVTAYNGEREDGPQVTSETDIPAAERGRLRDVLGSAQPEMAILKFFKNIVDRFLAGAPRELARERYEALVGPGTFAQLMSMSTLMPAKDYLKAIRWYHASPAARFGADDEDGLIGQLRADQRQDLLIGALASIAQEAFGLAPNPPGAATLASELTDVLGQDVLFPLAGDDVVRQAREELAAYEKAKEKAELTVCPTCNAAIQRDRAISARSDFYDKPDAFSNRRRAHGRRAADALCSGCYYERLTLQILLNGKPEEVVVIMPEMQLTLAGADELRARVDEWTATARQLGSPQHFDPQRSFDITATWRLARALGQASTANTPFEGMLASAFTYAMREETAKKRVRDLAKAIEALPDIDLAWVSDLAERPIADWTAAAQEALRPDSPLRKEPDIAEAIRSVYQLDRATLRPAISSNMVIVPLLMGFSGRDDSDVKAGIRRLIFTLFLAAALDAAVATAPFGEEGVVASGRRLGVAYVPSIGALRRLVGTDWISRSDVERWLRKLTAAVDLTGLTDYPPRNDLYVLARERARGKVVRRIEQVGKGNYLKLSNFDEIEAMTSEEDGA
jgi:hypothetical protein